MSTKSKSLHGHSFSSLTRGIQVDSKSEKTLSPSPSPSTTPPPVGNRVVATRSTRQPRLSFSAFAPSSENDHQKKTKPEEQKEEVPVTGEEEEEEEEKRTWNLRPRKKEVSVTEMKNQKSSSVEPKSNRQRGIAAESPGLGGGGGVEVGENHRLWIALSRDEIEEDLFSMSGNRASRRPRKRTKTLQKYIDVISPGLCLVGMNADCFRVSISPAKCSDDWFVYEFGEGLFGEAKRIDRYGGDQDRKKAKKIYISQRRVLVSNRKLSSMKRNYK